MKYLVTGPGGFLGRHIVEKLLARGDSVRGFARHSQPELEARGMEMRLGDLSDSAAVLDACNGVDAVFHVAAIAGIGANWNRYYLTNVVGTENVLNGCLKSNVSRMVYTSSPSVVFTNYSLENVDESTPYPKSFNAHYPRSKAMAEQKTLAFNGRQTADGQTLSTCALRPHLIWGPGDHNLIPRLIQRAKAGILRRVGEGKNLVDTTYVENAADGHIAAMDALLAGTKSIPAGKAYFLSQDDPVNCWGWIDQLLDIYHLPPVKKAMPFSAAYAIGAVYDLIWSLIGRESDPPMSKFLAIQLSVSNYFNISAAKRDFGYNPKISNDEGMKRMAEEADKK